jgi:hypothetical protein
MVGITRHTPAEAWVPLSCVIPAGLKNIAEGSSVWAITAPAIPTAFALCSYMSKPLPKANLVIHNRLITKKRYRTQSFFISIRWIQKDIYFYEIPNPRRMYPMRIKKAMLLSFFAWNMSLPFMI